MANKVNRFPLVAIHPDAFVSVVDLLRGQTIPADVIVTSIELQVGYRVITVSRPGYVSHGNGVIHCGEPTDDPEQAFYKHEDVYNTIAEAIRYTTFKKLERVQITITWDGDTERYQVRQRGSGGTHEYHVGSVSSAVTSARENWKGCVISMDRSTRRHYREWLARTVEP